MDHKEIRFRVLHCLYLKYYSDQLGHLQPTEHVIEESGLQRVPKNEVNGNLLYLSERQYLKGEYYLGSVEPAALMITTNGIDYIEEVMNNIISAVEKGQLKPKLSPTLTEILELSSPIVKTKKLIEYLQFDPVWNNVLLYF